MDRDESRLNRMREEWAALDEAVWGTASVQEILWTWPWESAYPAVQTAWEVLTRPEHLADLEYRWSCSDGGADMNEYAAEVTRKAIEVCRSRAMAAEPGAAPDRPRD
jgi:hypothetical protein